MPCSLHTHPRRCVLPIFSTRCPPPEVHPRDVLAPRQRRRCCCLRLQHLREQQQQRPHVQIAVAWLNDGIEGRGGGAAGVALLRRAELAGRAAALSGWRLLTRHGGIRQDMGRRSDHGPGVPGVGGWGPTWGGDGGPKFMCNAEDSLPRWQPMLKAPGVLLLVAWPHTHSCYLPTTLGPPATAGI